jgi:hypothetical protein
LCIMKNHFHILGSKERKTLQEIIW